MTSVDISLFKSKFLKILGFFGFYLVAWQPKLFSAKIEPGWHLNGLMNNTVL